MTSRWFLSALVFLIVLSAALFSPGVAAQTDAEQDFETGRAAGVEVSWRVVGENLEVILEAPTTGWVAIGFDRDNRRAGANMIT